MGGVEPPVYAPATAPTFFRSWEMHSTGWPHPGRPTPPVHLRAAKARYAGEVYIAGVVRLQGFNLREGGACINSHVITFTSGRVDGLPFAVEKRGAGARLHLNLG